MSEEKTGERRSQDGRLAERFWESMFRKCRRKSDAPALIDGGVLSVGAILAVCAVLVLLMAGCE